MKSFWRNAALIAVAVVAGVAFTGLLFAQGAETVKLEIPIPQTIITILSVLSSLPLIPLMQKITSKLWRNIIGHGVAFIVVIVGVIATPALREMAKADLSQFCAFTILLSQWIYAKIFGSFRAQEGSAVEGKVIYPDEPKDVS